MSVGLLTGYGGSSQSNDELLGAWDNTSLGVSLEFKDEMALSLTTMGSTP